MSPIFGHKDEESRGNEERFEQWRGATQAEFERLNALSMIELSTEVMTKGFGPDGPGADDDSITLGQANANSGPTADGISYRFAPDWDSRSPSLTNEDAVGLHSSAARCRARFRPPTGKGAPSATDRRGRRRMVGRGAQIGKVIRDRSARSAGLGLLEMIGWSADVGRAPL